MIQEAYCSYEIAKLLKEKGFDELCKYLYKDNSERYTLASTCYQNVCDDGECLCPTHQMAMRWLREVHLIHIYAEYKAFFQEKPKKEYYHWMPFVRTLPNCPIYNSGFPNYLDIYCDSHEEAIEAALKYTLENLL